MSDYKRENQNQGQNHHSDDSFDPSWLLIVVAFACFWPVGLGLLLYKLSGSSTVRAATHHWQETLDEKMQHQTGQTAYHPPKAQANSSQHSKWEAQTAKQRNRQARREARRNRHGAPASDRRSPARMNNGTALTILGAIIAIAFSIATCQSFLAWMPGSLWTAIRSAIVPFILTGVGFGTLAMGRVKHRQTRRLRKMLNMVGSQKVIDIRALANAFPTSYAKACNDIQNLIDGGYLGSRAYIDMSNGQLVLDSNGFQSPPKPEAAPPVDQNQRLLAEIRRVNDAIPGEEMSRKIDRIEESTRHILAYQKKHPEKASQMHTFLDYYLPTTLKILRAYAELEQQGLRGENVTATKERIEAMMDSVVEGFEAQLDKLFEGDMLDISADIAVMEKMLSRDGLSGRIKMPKSEPSASASKQPYTPTLTLDPNEGGTAVQTDPKQSSGF